MRIAIDAMGGDFAPREVVAGALIAARDRVAREILLVGRRNEVEAEIEAQGGAPANISVVDAPDVIEMAASPVEALKRTPGASILVALQQLRLDNADAVLAAGSTGAAVAASMMVLKRLKGVKRPGIAIPLPSNNAHGVGLLLDAGANPNCRPRNLLQYAVMGTAYYRQVFGEENPRVGLVSIGEEETKGNALTKDAAKLLRHSGLNFVGNVESRNVFGGACDVAVCDGFVGNIILKTAEGVVELMMGMTAEVLKDRDPQALHSVAKRLDYAEFGGAPLLGFERLVTICHGRSDRRAISNAIRASARAVDKHMGDRIIEGLARHQGMIREQAGAES